MKSLVIFAVAGVLAFLLRGKSAALRGLVWNMAILGCLMVSVFFLTLTPYEIGILPGKPFGFEADMLVGNNQPTASSVPIAPRPLPTTTRSSTHITPPPIQPEPATGESGAPQLNGSRTAFVSLHWTDWLALVWAAVGLFLLARLVAGVGVVWYISARGDDFSGSIRELRPGLRLGWRRPVRVKKSNVVTVPMVWGFFRPTIMLPADADNWQKERLRAVLLHELAHIQQNDWESQLIAQMMCAVYWFNPLVWFAARRMQVEAERACDDHVLNAGYQSTNYAEHLLEIARNVKTVGSVSRAAVAIARSSRIEERIRMILAENLNRRPLTKLAVVVGYCITTFLPYRWGQCGWRKRSIKRRRCFKKFRRRSISELIHCQKTRQRQSKRRVRNSIGKIGKLVSNFAISFSRRTRRANSTIAYILRNCITSAIFDAMPNLMRVLRHFFRNAHLRTTPANS